MHGKWSVDIDATIEKAKTTGLPDSAAPRTREIYDGGQLEITSDTLVMRVAGIPDAIARNYKVVGEADNCCKLKISGAPGVHTYCIENDHLVVQDPTANLLIVYSIA